MINRPINMKIVKCAHSFPSNHCDHITRNMYFPRMNILQFFLNISLIFCEIENLNYKNLLKKIGKYEIVHPKIWNKSEIHRFKRSSPEASGRNIDLNIYYISLNNLTIEASKNEDVVVPKSFESHDIKSGKRKISIDDTLRLQNCRAVHGSVTDVPGSSVVLTICGNEIFGLVVLEGKPHFIQPINDEQHVIYETKIPEKLKNMMKSGGMKFEDNEIRKSSAEINDKKFENESHDLEFRSGEASLCSDTENDQQLVGENKTTEYSRYESNKRCRRALTICDTREKIKMTRDIAGMDYLDMVDPSTRLDSAAEHQSPFMGFESTAYPFTRAMKKGRRRYNRRPRHLTSKWIKMVVGVDCDVIDFHKKRSHQYVYTILNIVSTLFKQISKQLSLKIVVLKLFMYPDPKESAIYAGGTRYPLYSVNRWNREVYGDSREKHDMAVWMTQYELGEDVKTVPGIFMCQYLWHCILIEDAGWLSAVKIAHGIGHLIGMTHDGDIAHNNNCASESLLRTTIMSAEIPTVIPIPVWSSCSMQEFHINILKYHCLERPPVHFENSAFMSGVFSLDEQCRIEFGEGWLFCSRIMVPDPCKELWCNRDSGNRRSCLTRQTPTLEGTACGRGKRCINHTCEDAKRLPIETTTVIEFPEELPLPDIPSPQNPLEQLRPTLPPIISPHDSLFVTPAYYDPIPFDKYPSPFKKKKNNS